MTRVGVAAPGPFDYENGICMVHGLGKLEGLFNVDMRAELARAACRPTSIRFLNDAEAFLLGESVAGAARVMTGRSASPSAPARSGFLADGEIEVG